jgi:hypothetical protein
MRLPSSDEEDERVTRKAPGFGPGDHVVEPGTRKEMFRGQVIEVQPARPGHGDLHSRLDKVMDLNAAEGYVSSTDLLTRRSESSDFATDASVRRAGTNPATGQRYLEELSFEIFFKQSREHARERARDVIGAGVRRMFGIFVRERWPGSDNDGVVDCTVCEWSPERDDWMHLALDHVIADPCLRTPVPVKALIDKLESDNAAVRALIARGNPELQGYAAQVRREERLVAARDYVFRTLAHRKIAIDEAQRARILACADLEALERWLFRAMEVASAAELFD